MKNEKLYCWFRKEFTTYIILILLDPQNSLSSLSTDVKYKGPHAASAALVHMKQRGDGTDPCVCTTDLHRLDFSLTKKCEKRDIFFVFSESCLITLFKKWLYHIENSHYWYQKHS